MTQSLVLLIPVLLPLAFVFFVLAFWKATVLARKRQSSAEAYMERAERHDAAVEAKLDRIIAILEKKQDSENS
ncbi:MAG TPA: hypothetical protein VIM11_08780 [Tepidisphaeraceae bacterium]|jgi:hypothetical protein